MDTDQMTPIVQKVTKTSSNKLLTKFADDPLHKSTSLSKRQLVQGPIRLKRTSRRGVMTRISSSSSSSCTINREFRRSRIQLAEKKTLLTTASSVRSMLRPEFRARDICAVEFLMAKLEKTWRKTIEGTSRILMMRHCSPHVRLISDAV